MAMKKKKSIAEVNALRDAITKLKRSHGLSGVTSRDTEHEIVDIITFCEDPQLLNLPANNFNLYPAQRIILKSFYMGSLGNENLKLEESEWEWLYEREDVYETHALIEKIKRQERTKGTPEFIRFQELTLVLGRRSSKTAMTSIIAAYEAYKILTIGKGDPHTYYGIPFDKKIAIINVATAKKQAAELWDEIKARIRNSPFFSGRIEGDVADEINLFTDRDLKKREEGIGNLDIEGSVIMRCGHSNPKSLRGGAVICLMFDELAFYDEGAKVSGKAFYEALQPSVAQFANKGGGVIVEISSPGPRTGHFYTLYDLSLKPESTHRISMRMPTWRFNPEYTEDNPVLKDAKSSDEASYMVEYGADWPEGGLYGRYFPEELVLKSFELGMQNRVLPESDPRMGCEYYAHVDPSATGANFVCAIIRKQTYRDPATGTITPRLILVDLKVWIPQPGSGLDILKINEDLLVLFRKFNPRTVSYDQYPSDASLAYFKRNRVNVIKTSYNRGFKERIYNNLKDLMTRGDLWLFEHPLLQTELSEIRYKFTPRGRSIGADKRGDCPTDDCADALAGACFMACTNYYKGLPMATTVYTGLR
ncbi:MAG: hypothetical protein M0R32_06840 [Candidatus Cloacimonetes bacterium]|jgi:hypothetical protein|nr:hypothetical protein [Candidatus Cloacimonadota bacterium]